jgi:glycosyltransferase involved in cell wall biosynthesis
LDEFSQGSFSVVTPNYNMARFLPETIESVLQNLREGDQYFIIDGGSSDESVSIIQSFEGHLSGWISEPDNGYADALAKGFGQTKGEFQCWINSGDLLLTGALDNAREILERTGAEFIFGDDLYIDEESRVISFSRGYVRSLRNMMLYGGWTPLQDACFWRRSLYERVGGLNRNLSCAADYDLFLRFSLEGRSKYVPVAFSAFRKHDGQKSTSWAAKYEKERRECRSRELQRIERAKLGTVILGGYYWTFVRFRERVVRRFWNLRSLSKVPIRTLRSQSYR